MKISVGTWFCSVFAAALIAGPMGPAVAGAEPQPTQLCVIPFVNGALVVTPNSTAAATVTGVGGVSSVAIVVTIPGEWQPMGLRVLWKNIDTAASGEAYSYYDATGPEPTTKTFPGLATGLGRVGFEIGLNKKVGNHGTGWLTCTAEATV